MKTPIVLFIYKRSNNLDKIISVVRLVKPESIYIIADGAKVKNDEDKVKATRIKLESLINWPCHIRKNYSNDNLGLKERFKSGIDWVFTTTDRAIFIEDDCIPESTFFRFCDELLERFKNDKRIFSISGNNFQFGKKQLKDSYYFSKYPHIWGWATWKRSWELYDGSISDWIQRRNTSWLRKVSSGFIISKFWKYIFDRLYSGKINTWDYQLTYASFKCNGLNIIPSTNLVTNIGFGADSTNIKNFNKTIQVPTKPMKFPLVHPMKITTDNQADKRIEELVYLHFIGKVSLLIKSILGIL